jgi:hypothetical protein
MPTIILQPCVPTDSHIAHGSLRSCSWMQPPRAASSSVVIEVEQRLPDQLSQPFSRNSDLVRGQGVPSHFPVRSHARPS